MKQYVLQIQEEYCAKMIAQAGAGLKSAHSFSNCILAGDYYTGDTTPPLQGHSVDCCSGRKNRLMGGFFIFVRRFLDWEVYRVKPVFLTIARGIHLSLPLTWAISYTVGNTTATLSACKGNAQPWRFFYARNSRSTGGCRA